MTSFNGDKPRPSRKLILTLLLLVLLVLLLAAAAYAWRGNRAMLLGKASMATPAAGDPAVSVDAMVQRLAKRLAEKPDDAEGWTLLGRSYISLQRPADAVDAFRKRRALQPQDAQALADLADALAFAGNRRFDGEPEQLIQQALQLDPRNAKALELTGTIAFDRGNFRQAVRHWDSALAVIDPQSAAARNLQSGIAEAERRAAPTQTTGAGAQVSGRVVLAPALLDKVRPDDGVLIFARLLDGPRMPVAMLKRRASELPLDFRLDESTAMNPSLRLSPSMLVVVGVRISRSGQALPQRGDLQGFSPPVPVGSHGLLIEINDAVK